MRRAALMRRGMPSRGGGVGDTTCGSGGWYSPRCTGVVIWSGARAVVTVFFAMEGGLDFEFRGEVDVNYPPPPPVAVRHAAELTPLQCTGCIRSVEVPGFSSLLALATMVSWAATCLGLQGKSHCHMLTDWQEAMASSQPAIFATMATNQPFTTPRGARMTCIRYALTVSFVVSGQESASRCETRCIVFSCPTQPLFPPAEIIAAQSSCRRVYDNRHGPFSLSALSPRKPPLRCRPQCSLIYVAPGQAA